MIDGLITGLPEPAVGRFLAIPSGRDPMLNRIYVRQGRLPSDGTETEVIVHEGLAEGNGIRIGDSLTVLIQGQRETVRVVGIAFPGDFVKDRTRVRLRQ